MGHVSPAAPSLGVICHPYTLGLVTVNVCAKLEVPIITRYDNTKGNAKYILDVIN